MDVISDTMEPARVPAASSAGYPLASEAKLTQAVRWRTPVLSVPPSATPARNPSLPTFVALIILILTFFIVLTSMSMKDQSKSKAAIASLQDAFSGGAMMVEAVPTEEDEEIARDYIAGLTHRIQSLVPLMGGKKGPASDRQVLWLPAELAFAGDGLTPVFPTVLREIVGSLREVPDRLTPHFEMRLCTREADDQVRARAVAIGTALQTEQAPLEQFSIGIAQCDPRRIGIAVVLAPAGEGQRAGAGEQTP